MKEVSISMLNPSPSPIANRVLSVQVECWADRRTIKSQPPLIGNGTVRSVQVKQAFSKRKSSFPSYCIVWPPCTFLPIFTFRYLPFLPRHGGKQARRLTQEGHREMSTVQVSQNPEESTTDLKSMNKMWIMWEEKHLKQGVISYWRGSRFGLRILDHLINTKVKKRERWKEIQTWKRKRDCP